LCAALEPAESPAAERTQIGTYQSAQSPSGRIIALSGIGLGDVSPSYRMRLRVLLVRLGDTRVEEILTWLEGDWVVVWAPGDVIVVCGRPDNSARANIHVFSAYVCDPYAKATQRVPTESEKSLARKAFHEKYGRDP
jgi:hypothetical protein